MPRRARDRNVRELASARDTAEHEPSPAHVATADEFRGEAKPSLQRALDHVDVLSRRDAAEQDDGVIGVEAGRKGLDVPFERLPETQLVRCDPDGTHGDEIREPHHRARREEPGAGSHDVDSPAIRPVAGLCHATRERFPVRKLSAEIKPAHELEDLSERRPTVPEPQGQREFRRGTNEELRAFSAAVRRGQKEDGPRRRGVLGSHVRYSTRR